MATLPLVARGDERVRTREIEKNTALIDSIIHEISTSQALHRLDSDSRAAFLSRFREFLLVRSEGTTAEYIAMMKEWGCNLNAVPGTPEFNRLIEGWHPVGTELCIASVKLAELQVLPHIGDEAAAAAKRPWPVTDKRSLKCLNICVFSPDRPQDAMLRADRTLLDIIYPATTEDGTQMAIGYRFVWDSRTKSWFPWLMHYEVEFGKPGPMLFF